MILHSANDIKSKDSKKIQTTPVTQSFFDAKAAGWDTSISAANKTRLSKIFKTKISEIKGPILDLGCGTGILIDVFRQNGSAGQQIIECDISRQMLKVGREKTTENRNIAFTQADGHHLSFQDNTFGSVVCFAVFPHFHDKQGVLSEIRRVLKPGGNLIILHLMGHKELNAMHREAGREVENDRIIPVEQLSRIVAGAGYTVNEFEEKEDIFLIIAQKK